MPALVKTLLVRGAMCRVNALTTPDSLAASRGYVTQIWPVRFKLKFQGVALGKIFQRGQRRLDSPFSLIVVMNMS